MTPAQSKTYWLSSRMVEHDGLMMLYFGLQNVKTNGISKQHLCNVNYLMNSNSDSFAVRPLVSFPKTSYKLKYTNEAFEICKTTGSRRRVERRHSIKLKPLNHLGQSQNIPNGISSRFGPTFLEIRALCVGALLCPTMLIQINTKKARKSQKLPLAFG